MLETKLSKGFTQVSSCFLWRLYIDYLHEIIPFLVFERKQIESVTSSDTSWWWAKSPQKLGWFMAPIYVCGVYGWFWSLSNWMLFCRNQENLGYYIWYDDSALKSLSCFILEINIILDLVDISLWLWIIIHFTSKRSFLRKWIYWSFQKSYL